MHTYLAAAVANCNTGSWQQKWQCGWNQPTTGAANAGNFTGHNVLPGLLVLAVIVLVVMAAKKSRSGARSAPAKASRR
jgi:hypothetical protein